MPDITSDDGAHLTEKTRTYLATPGEDRILSNWKAIWIGHHDAKHVHAKLDMMLKTPPSSRPKNLLVYGESNVGKSTILERWAEAVNQKAAVAAEAEDPEAMGDWAVLPVVRVQTPPKGDEGRLYDNILRAMGFPLPISYSASAKCQTVLKLLANNQTKIVMLDEFHNALSGRFDQRLHFNVVIKNLTNEAGIPLVVAGVEAVEMVFNKEDQLHRRFSRIKLEAWRDNDDWRKLLRSFERLIPLKHPSSLAQPEMATTLYEVSSGRIGDLSDVLREAAIRAILSGEERITPDMIQAV
nr:TniB family NTP-binding protein [uncultured Brevundimonas sp.]